MSAPPAPTPATVENAVAPPSPSNMQTSSTAGSPSGSPKQNDNTPRLMILKMEVLNFKSYAGKKTVGPFHKNFSAVVGPNGSGKSNVIDALLFVFGKRASKLRLKKVSELIHKSSAIQIVRKLGLTSFSPTLLIKVRMTMKLFLIRKLLYPGMRTKVTYPNITLTTKKEPGRK